jgi:hypothetical protein
MNRQVLASHSCLCLCPAAQVVLPGLQQQSWANMTLMSLVLENLPYGDAASLDEAEGNSILLANRLWPFRYRR